MGKAPEMDKVREMLGTVGNSTLLDMWWSYREDRSDGGIAFTEVVVKELVRRNVIALNPDTLEYEIL